MRFWITLLAVDFIVGMEGMGVIEDNPKKIHNDKQQKIHKKTKNINNTNTNIRLLNNNQIQKQ